MASKTDLQITIIGEGVSFTVRTATKDEIAQAREIIDEAQE